VSTRVDILDEGANSYLDALAAIEAYQKEVRNVCRHAYDKRKPDLVSKIGLENASCVDFTYPEPGEMEKPYAELGVRQNSPSARETLYVYLMWDGDAGGAPEISACVSLEFSRNDDRGNWAAKLGGSPSIRRGENKDLCSSKKLSDLTSCAEALGELLNEWIEFWPVGKRLK